MAVTALARRFFGGRIAADPLLSGPLVGGFHGGVAPTGTPYPYLTMHLQAPGRNLIPLGGALIWSNMLWLLKVYDEGRSTARIEPIADRLTARLHGASGAVGAGVVYECTYEEPFEQFERIDGNDYVSLGGLYRLRAK